MKNINNKIFGLLSSLVILFGAVVPSAGAEEITISGNGPDSTSQVNATTTQQTNVDQSNTLDVSNDVDTDANTGDNSASDNTGSNTEVATGDIQAVTNITNSGNLSSVSSSECTDCKSTISTIISGNAARSQNTANYTFGSELNVDVNQRANILNNVTTNANTGRNQANDNRGNVSIKTGNIFVKNDILNGPINVSKVKVAGRAGIDALLKIAGNGTSSLNSIDLSIDNDSDISVTNVSDIINNIASDLNTGENSANDNAGNVKINTGDIWTEIKVKNLANISEVIVECGCKQKPGEEKPPILPPSIVTTPPSSTSGGVGGPGGAGGGSSAVAAAIENILPATGTNWLILALLGNIMMLFLGAYLRLRSGRSPGLALAI